MNNIVPNREVLTLIRAHYEHNDDWFRNTARDIAKYFSDAGKLELAMFILAQLEEIDTWVPQEEV